LIAIAYLPVNDRTIVYGSNNAGFVVHDSDPKMRSLMEKASSMLNLAPHPAGYHADRRKLLYAAADVEGHKGTVCIANQRQTQRECVCVCESVCSYCTNILEICV
jgi:hypothetical protein